MHHHRLKFLGGRPRTAFASRLGPPPHVAPAGLYLDDDGRCGAYIPGPVLVADNGVVLFGDPAAKAIDEGKRIRDLPLWLMLLQMAIVLAACMFGGVVIGTGQ